MNFVAAEDAMAAASLELVARAYSLLFYAMVIILLVTNRIEDFCHRAISGRC